MVDIQLSEILLVYAHLLLQLHFSYPLLYLMPRHVVQLSLHNNMFKSILYREGQFKNFDENMGSHIIGDFLGTRPKYVYSVKEDNRDSAAVEDYIHGDIK